MAKARITDRAIAALKPGAVLWDTEVPGLGLRKATGTTGGYDSFQFKYRSPVEGDGTGRGKQRVLTLGRRGRGDLGIDDARKEATALRLQIRAGIDPALARDDRKRALTVAELSSLYLAALPTILVRGKPKKPSTVRSDRSNIERHIKPLLGHLAVAAVQPADVRTFLHQVAAGRTAAARASGRGAAVTGGRGAATRATGLLGGIFAYAVREGLRADNPVRGIERFADGRRDRRLADGEYAALGTALRAAEALPVWPPAIAMTRFLLLTGWRSGEALALRWQDVDLARRTATLPDSKTGRSMRPLSAGVCELLRGLDRHGELVFPGTRPDTRMGSFPRLFGRLLAMAGLPDDITPHVLRHSFASLGGDLGLSDPTIGALIGHRTGTVTGRYTHLADAPLLAAADRVAGEVLARMGGSGQGGEVVPLRA